MSPKVTVFPLYRSAFLSKSYFRIEELNQCELLNYIYNNPWEGCIAAGLGE